MWTRDPAAKFFTARASDRDRAVFEAGIALGMVMHQFSGIPVRSEDDVAVIEEAMKRAILSQPFRTNATVRLGTKPPSRQDPYSYTTIKTRDMNVCVEVRYNRVKVKACVKYIEELDFNLAYIDDIVEES